MVLRIFGAASLAAGALLLLADMHISATGLSYRPTALGVYWHHWDAASLNLLQAAIERHILPQLWSHVLLPLLLSPAWMVAAGLGAALTAFTLKRQGGHNTVKTRRNGNADQNP